MGLFKYFKGRIGYVLAIVVLLAAQASCDLAPPNYTSDIVDVGIGQSGVQDALPVEMRTSTMDAVLMLSSASDRDLISEGYSKQGDSYVLNEAGEENAEQLEDALEYPLVMCYYADQSDEMDIDQAVSAYKAGAIDDAQVQQIMADATDQLDQMGDSIVSQQAIAAVKAEYEACGVDMDAMQRNYLLSIGARMIGVTLLGALCAAAVAFLASRTGAGIARDLRERLFRKVVGFSDAEVQKFSAASLITRSTNDIQQIQMV
ncbi:MAG: ABC transporter transmembrane domain-containing protein, partial [Eggerthellaceae bacterium]